ncbi:hypothetical protein KFL_002800150 [Klebsormidium nitens]|uniref:Uncharacterized protein n=1 Tax=Klebsormidium nitens TaxID=105231 RepID=A0A1Y1I5Q9_KLENI|nr:hypothetical protein KFL_002800150 [Klebsormidium nitens]|eukprot:GAQ86285.1 hypothetical protein KFL_002800150 [Klebsormidium nitens]
MDASAAFPAFVQLNCGTWSGTFYQFNAFGKVLESIQTTMEVTSSGTADDLMMQQRLKVQDQAVGAASASDSESVFDLHSSRTSLGDSQQLSYFPGDGAFSLSHQTAEALDALLRKGLSKKKDGEDIDRTVRYPSERPALVSECCLHSDSGDRRVRAIHVLDTRGLLDQIGVFVESKTEGEELETQDDPGSRIDALLGKWKGRASSRRTALYGGTVTEYDSSITYTKGPEGTLEQVLKMGPSGFELKSTASLDGSVILYPGGLQTTLLPGGIAVTCPLNVKPGQSFYFEMSWIVNPGHRSRLIRTYDLDGLVVSTTLIKEVKS